MGKYIYESHLGGLYTSDLYLSWDDLYCDSCGDSDWLLGFAGNRKEAKRMIEEHDMYSDKYIKKFLDEEFPERR